MKLEEINDLYTKNYNLSKKELGEELFPINNCQFFMIANEQMIDYVENESVKQKIVDLCNQEPLWRDLMPAENTVIVLMPPKDKKKWALPKVLTFFVPFSPDNDIRLILKHNNCDSLISELESDMYKPNIVFTQILASLIAVLSMKETKVAQKLVNVRANSAKQKILPITYIQPVTTKNDYNYFFPNEIDWKHSWEVIGHWRVCSNVGKDKNGEYNQIGRTWVNPSIKGKGELIKKIRIIK